MRRIETDDDRDNRRVMRLLLLVIAMGAIVNVIGAIKYSHGAPIDDRYAHVQSVTAGAAKARHAGRRQASGRGAPAGILFTGSAIAIARAYIGTNPTGQRRAWCADFMNLVERRLGRPGTGSRLAASYLHYGARVSSAAAGDIALIARGRRIGHVGYVSGTCDGGLLIVSGNHNRTTAEACYPRGRIVAVVRPGRG